MSTLLMACNWITLQCTHGEGCTWVWTGYSSAAKSAWAAHSTIAHKKQIKVACATCNADTFQLCDKCSNAAPPCIAVHPFYITTFESTLLASLLEKAVVKHGGRSISVEQAPGRRGGYDGAFLSHSILLHKDNCVSELSNILKIVASAPAWVLKTVLAAAPIQTAISPLLGRLQATQLALQTGKFTPCGGRTTHSLREACELDAVEPCAVIAAVTAWPSQYVICAVAACCRRRHALAAALAAVDTRATVTVITTLVVDNAPRHALNTALGAGFDVASATLTAALRQRPLDHTTLLVLLKAAPRKSITDAVLAAATQAASWDEYGTKALVAVLRNVKLNESFGQLALTCALMTGNHVAWNILRSAGGTVVTTLMRPTTHIPIEMIVYATCRMRGPERIDAITLLIGGKRNRATEKHLRKQIKLSQSVTGFHVAEWACAMLTEADELGVKEFIRWVAPLLDEHVGWLQAIYSAAAVFASTSRINHYLVIATSYGSKHTPNPVEIMVGLPQDEATDSNVQWLIDCRPHILAYDKLKSLSAWSPTAALACNATGKSAAKRPSWWIAIATTVLLSCIKTQRAPEEIARLICSFVVSQVKPQKMKCFSLL